MAEIPALRPWRSDLAFAYVTGVSWVSLFILLGAIHILRYFSTYKSYAREEGERVAQWLSSLGGMQQVVHGFKSQRFIYNVMNKDYYYYH